MLLNFQEQQSLKELCCMGKDSGSFWCSREERIKWAHPSVWKLFGTPPPVFANDLWPLGLSWVWASQLQAVHLQSTLQFYRPVEPKITRLLNSWLPSVWLPPLFLEPKSFLTTLQKQAIRLRSVNPLLSN